MNWLTYVLSVLLCLFKSFEISADEQKYFQLDLNYLPAKEIAVVQLSFDGINTYGSGVGTVVLQTQKALKDLNNHFKDEAKFKLYLVSGDYSETLPEYSRSTLEKNVQDCNLSGGGVHIIPITKKEQMFGDPEQWSDLCMKGAEICAQIIQENAYTIIIAHDTAYAQLPRFLQTICMKGEIEKPYRILWVPHATSWTYNGHTQEGIAKWPERHRWELSAFQNATSYEYQIGYISDTIRRDITAMPFNVPERALVFYRTGILLEPFLEDLSEKVLIQELQKRSIPLDKRLIFSIGRANPLKGQDITLEMYRHLKQQYSDIHLVMLAPLSDYMPSYLKILKDRIAKENLDVTLIDSFDSKLAHYMYQWPKTVLVSLLSRMDTQPLTVMEARANPKNSIVLTGDPDRMGNQVMNRIDGFICSLKGLTNILIQNAQPLTGSLKQIVEQAKTIIDISNPEERNKIIEAGKKRIAEDYDLRKNLIKNLEALFTKKEVIFAETNFDPCEELKEHAEEVQDLFNLPSRLIFEKVQKGMSNPPILVSTTSEDGKIPVRILKQTKGNLQTCALQLRLLSEIQSKSFLHIPRIFKDKHGCYVTKIGDHFYSMIEYVPQDQRNPSFEEMLELTGKFHQKSKELVPCDQIKYSKLDEFRSRAKLFSDPWFQGYKSKFFTNANWQKAIELSCYFSSESFQSLYEKLPMQLIHGDNNQTNVVLSKDCLYLVDFDSVRLDVKMLDLASYFRYGGFEYYMYLTHQNRLLEIIKTSYGKNAPISLIEERNLHTIVAFSHIEFMSWVLKMLKSASLENDLDKEKEMMSYLTLYSNQINQVFPFAKEEIGSQQVKH